MNRVGWEWCICFFVKRSFYFVEVLFIDDFKDGIINFDSLDVLNGIGVVFIDV